MRSAAQIALVLTLAAAPALSSLVTEDLIYDFTARDVDDALEARGDHRRGHGAAHVAWEGAKFAAPYVGQYLANQKRDFGDMHPLEARSPTREGQFGGRRMGRMPHGATGVGSGHPLRGGGHLISSSGAPRRFGHGTRIGRVRLGHAAAAPSPPSEARSFEERNIDVFEARQIPGHHSAPFQGHYGARLGNGGIRRARLRLGAVQPPPEERSIDDEETDDLFSRDVDGEETLEARQDEGDHRGGRRFRHGGMHKHRQGGRFRHEAPAERSLSADEDVSFDERDIDETTEFAERDISEDFEEELSARDLSEASDDDLAARGWFGIAEDVFKGAEKAKDAHDNYENAKQHYRNRKSRNHKREVEGLEELD